MKIDEEPVVVEQSFDASVETVWNAITVVVEMRQWYFDNIPAFDPRVGFETQFNIHNEGRDFLHLWKVLAVEPLKKLTYEWKFKGYAGDSFVTWELFKHDDSTTLRLTCTVLEDFSDDIPEFQRKSCLAGWRYFLRERLKEYLETHEES